MPKAHLAGYRVFQAQYGHGTVTASDEHHTIVDFDAHGSRTFATARAQLEPSATPAPIKLPRAPRRSKRRT